MTTLALRIFDMILSTMGLLVLTPVMILILLFSIAEADRPIFCQERLGRNKVLFSLVKFRTMVPSTPSVATHLVSSSAVTPFGQFLRRTKLDELPQLWSVFKGDMSIVGPRPGLPNQVELTAARERLGVFNVRPGITGLAQVSGIDMSTPELLAQTDARMIAEISIRNYFKYIFLTVLGKGSGDRIKS
jgi:lipopolysaccharide/colanic/teichoic acid biosynthesis glycosyltransferase